jgi:hypothetical protein
VKREIDEIAWTLDVLSHRFQKETLDRGVVAHLVFDRLGRGNQLPRLRAQGVTKCATISVPRHLPPLKKGHEHFGIVNAIDRFRQNVPIDNDEVGLLSDLD